MYAIIDRVMSLVRKAAPTFYRYSIDEAFCDLSGMDNLQSSISRSAEGRNNLQFSARALLACYQRDARIFNL